jgi:hypothetical protein
MEDREMNEELVGKNALGEAQGKIPITVLVK